MFDELNALVTMIADREGQEVSELGQGSVLQTTIHAPLVLHEILARQGRHKEPGESDCKDRRLRRLGLVLGMTKLPKILSMLSS